MNKIHSIFKISLLMLIFLFISACSDSISPYNVSLITDKTDNYSQISIQPNRNLKMHISEKFENPQLIGGNGSSREINFQEIMPWLRSRLVNINSLDCVLTKKINIEISVKKLYTAIDCDVVSVGTLVLNAKIVTADGKTLVRNYRGDCKMDFFTLNQKNGIRACLNSSLDLIITNIKHDICEINM